MSNLPDLVRDQYRGAQAFAEQTAFGDFGQYPGDLLLRNPVVALERAQLAGFDRMPKSAQDHVIATADLSRRLAPFSGTLSRKPYESPEDFTYRREVLDPIHAVQANLNVGSFEARQFGRIAGIVSRGARIFEDVLTVSGYSLEIQNSREYFGANISTALSQLSLAEASRRAS